MKRKVLGILNILVGILQIVYFLLQNGTIKIKAFIVNYQYTKSFEQFMNIFMCILLIFIIILLIFTIISYCKRKKDNTNYVGEVLIIGSHAISIIGFVFMSMTTIFSPLSIIGGILQLSKVD